MKESTLGSLFDGSGGFPLAASMCGITPVFASEVEPYPIAVTRSRFPNMIHLGDVSKVHGYDLTPVDVVTFGSHCQSLSVAGKREGLRHTDMGDDETTRSGLFIEAIRIITEMREATDGMYPTFAVWENVPGAFSSSGGADFQTVLGKLAQIKDPNISIPQPDRWLTAGEIVGDGFSIAWRTVDAQYFGKSVRDRDSGDVLVRGTPQRRRRIYLVADFAGQRAGKILFECAGVPGNSEPCAETRQGAAADVKGSVGDAECLTPWDYQSKRVFSDQGAFATLPSGETSGQNQQAVCYGISAYESNAMKSSNPHSGIYEADTSRTLDLNGGNPACNQGGIAVVEAAASFLDRNSANARSIGYEDEEAPTIRESMIPSVVCSLFENHSQDTRFKGPLDVSPMLPAQLGTGGNNTPFVVEQTYCLQGSMIGRADKNGPQGDGVNEDVSFTCNTTDRHAVAYVESYQKVTGPLMANSHPGSYCGQDAYSDMLITPIPYRQGVAHDYVVAAVDCRNGTENYDVNETLQAHPSGGTSLNLNNVVRHAVAYAAGFCPEQSEKTRTEGNVCGTFQNTGVRWWNESPVAATIRTPCGGDATLANVCAEKIKTSYIVRRLTPTECARLQGFPDTWGHPDVKTELTDEEYAFWLGVRNTHASINGKPQKTYTREQMLKWYNNLHTDSAEYKMWGNGIALPCAVFVMQGIAEELKKQKQDLKG